MPLASPSISHSGWIQPTAQNWRPWEIDAYGEQCAKKLGYVPGDHLIPILRKLDGKLEYADLDQLDRPERGSIEIRKPHDFTITLPILASQVAQRFTIAHEL
jgi:hypothetical protein